MCFPCFSRVLENLPSNVDVEQRIPNLSGRDLHGGVRSDFLGCSSVILFILIEHFYLANLFEFMERRLINFNQWEEEMFEMMISCEDLKKCQENVRLKILSNLILYQI